MFKRVLSLLLVLLMLAATALSEGATVAGTGVADSYDTGMTLFELEDYALASEFFANAGNYRDAKKWTYYCEAIAAVLDCGGDADALTGAQVRFELLAAQSFADADQWAQYCKARAYESSAMISRAQELYATIAIHDSVERYLTCMDKHDVLESAESVRSRMAGAAGTADEFYESGMTLFYLEDYTLAADYFCLAGNYEDARLWRCYCTGIALVTQVGRLADANVLFALLSSQGFGEATPWQTYCTARSYEEMGFTGQAIELYKTIFVYDSSERYLSLSGY